MEGRDKPPAAVLIETLNHHHHHPSCVELGLDERGRTELMAMIVSVIRFEHLPPNVKQSALDLVGWLARRQVSERPCETGVVEARRQSMLPPAEVG